jgi:hypothetical protein
MARSKLELRLIDECKAAAAALDGRVLLAVGRDSSGPGSAHVTVLPAAACGGEPGSDAGSGSGSSGKKLREGQRWQALILRVGSEYPAQPPTAVFPCVGHGGLSADKAAAAEQQQLLLDAARSRFASRLAEVALPAAVQLLAAAWLEATESVAARIASRQLQEQQQQEAGQ